MWRNFLNSKWFERLFTGVIAIILLFLTQKVADISTKKQSIEEELRNKASYEYVDKQDNNVLRVLNQHVLDQADNDRQLMEYIKSIDGKINILIQKKDR